MEGIKITLDQRQLNYVALTLEKIVDNLNKIKEGTKNADHEKLLDQSLMQLGVFTFFFGPSTNALNMNVDKLFDSTMNDVKKMLDEKLGLISSDVNELVEKMKENLLLSMERAIESWKK